MQPSWWALVIYALVIIGAGYVVGSWLAGAARLALERARLDPAVRHLLVNLVRPLVLIVAVIAALQVVGVDLTAMIAVLGAATLAVGLSLQDSLANVAAGALLLTLRPFRGGDWVEVAGQSGTVTELGLFTTGLKTGQGVHVVLPNNLVVKSPIQNYTRNGMRRADITFRVAANADLPKVHAALIKLLEDDETVLNDPAPFVRLTGLDSQGVDVLVAAWFDNAKFAEGKSQLIRSVRDALKKARIGLSTDAAVVVSG